MNKLVLAIGFAIVLAACSGEAGGIPGGPAKIVVQPAPCPPSQLDKAASQELLSRVETTLDNAGYTRYPFVDDQNIHGFYWSLGNAWQFVRTCETGVIDLVVLNDKFQSKRMELMEQHLSVLSEIMPPKFMLGLRETAQAYVDSRPGRGVDGAALTIRVYDNEWNTIIATYNREEHVIEGYDIAFQLEFTQYECPHKYSYCFYQGFPGLEFYDSTSSFTFFEIEILAVEPKTDQPSTTPTAIPDDSYPSRPSRHSR